MVNRKNILFISSAQFGYHTDSYFYANLLSEKFNVFYIGYDHGKDCFENTKVKVYHIPFNLGKFKSRVEMIRLVNDLNKNHDFTYTMIFYFTFSSLFRFFSKDTIQIMDIRTSFIFKSKFRRYIYNRLMCVESKLFKHVTIISNSLRKFLQTNQSMHILPLGAPYFDCPNKNFDCLKLLYVGTFYERDIEKTVLGFKEFLNVTNFPTNVKYTIVGFGSSEEILKIKSAIEDNNLGKYINYVGEVRYPALNKYFSDHNVGVSFIPLTPYYDCQPPTKTFEYLLNGMPVLATSTSENSLVISSDNGVLINDTSEDFCKGLLQLYRQKEAYKSSLIKENAKQFTWDHIVNENLIPYLSSLNK